VLGSKRTLLQLQVRNFEKQKPPFARAIAADANGVAL
jgi:hypothetical protein